MNTKEITKQKAKIAIEKLFIYSGFIALGHSILVKDGNIFSAALILEATSITALLGSTKVLHQIKQKELNKKQ